MKRTYKSLNILGYVLIVVLVFLCGFNVTYAYFTARATVQGNLQFYDLNVQFAYYYEQPIATGTTEYEIIPATTNVLRGVPFTFKTAENQAIESVGLQAMSDSCNYYARVKVKAVKMVFNGSTYEQDSSDTTDYGNYINLTINSDNILQGPSGWYYFKGAAMEATSYYTLATGATISTSAPVDLTNGYLKITLSFEAVQANKEAVKSVFGLTDANLTTLGWSFE